MTDANDLLTTPQVGELLSLSVRPVKQLVQVGHLRPTHRVGNYNVFSRDVIGAFAATPLRRTSAEAVSRLGWSPTTFGAAV